MERGRRLQRGGAREPDAFGRRSRSPVRPAVVVRRNRRTQSLSFSDPAPAELGGPACRAASPSTWRQDSHHNRNVGPVPHSAPCRVDQHHDDFLPRRSHAVQNAPVHDTARGENPHYTYQRDTLDIHLSDKLLEDIAQGKAIQMARIFDNDPRRNPYVLDSDDESSKSKGKDKERRLNRYEWVEAYTIYSYAYIKYFPECAGGMLVHMAHVLELQSARADWHFYDITVRRLIARQGRQWDESFTEERMSARARGDRNPPRAPSTGYSMPKHDVPKGYCVAYHKHNDCADPCQSKFSHRCFKCSGEHRAGSCNGRRASFGRGGNESHAVREVNAPSSSFRGRGGNGRK